VDEIIFVLMLLGNLHLMDKNELKIVIHPLNFTLRMEFVPLERVSKLFIKSEYSEGI
jgi:hypothetical protein